MNAKGQSNKGKKTNKTGCMSWVDYCEAEMLKREDENNKLKLCFQGLNLENDALKKENEKMKEQLNLCRLCCKEALNGEWEINDEGFQSQIDQIDELIGKGVGVEWDVDV